MCMDAAKVCHKVWVVMYDPQGASENVQGGSPSWLPLGLGGMTSAFRVLNHGIQTIVVRVLGWMS